MKKFKLWSGMALLLLIMMIIVTGCNNVDDEPRLAPEVFSVYPIAEQEVSGVDLRISVTFNVAMNPATITTSTFAVKQDGVPVLGTVTYDNLTATFTPAKRLEHHVKVTATILKAAKNSNGQSLTSDYNWDFETCHPPNVVSVSPSNNSECVALDQPIQAVFADGETNPSTITTSTFTLFAGETPIAGTVTYTGTTATFTPTNELSESTVYTATITTGVKNYLGTPLENARIWNFTTTGPSCNQVSECGPLNVDLKTAGDYGILAGTAITNVGLSVINNLNVGISPGFRSSITGFPPGVILNGAIYAADDIAPPGALVTQAQQDLADAYLFAQNATSPAPVIITGDLGGRTLVPGIYKSESSMLLQSGDLILDGGQSPCDENAVWIFQVGSAFTSVGGTGGNVILIGGAKAGRVFWQVGSSATIGDGTSFKGNILAFTSITLGAGSTVEGRALARNGAVTLAGANTINKP